MPLTPEPLVEIRNARKTFPRADGGEMLVLDGIDLTLREGEIVGLLGRSGSGKSTLLRLIAGLTPAIAGAVRCLGRPVTGPPPGVAMVFQSFALFPWLTVLENVQLGLEALGLPRDEIRRRAIDAIDLIGLDGFESAWPRELSGGMRQRVGFARALVVHPDILLMDEAFSDLDVLTAQTLRRDFLDLWAEGQLPIRGVLMVTHNIEEAVLMCDRIIVLGSSPGRIIHDLQVTLVRPRARLDPGFRDLVEEIYVKMTGLPEDSGPALRRGERFPGEGIGTVLPPVTPGLLAGLLETLAAAPYDGRADLPVIAPALQMEIDDLFPVAETLQMLRLAEVSGGDIALTPAGREFAQSGIDARKRLFASHLRSYLALAAHIRRVLDERPNQRAPWSRFSDELEDFMSPAAAEQTLRTAIDLCRYGELFAYDDESHIFYLEDLDTG
jgi:NitT/TauT family transport system ATP-binding protein